MKALVVDDHELFSSSFSLLLKKLLKFTEVVCLNSGEAALAHLKKNNYDFIFMDIHMPGMDGIETTKYIRERNPEAKVVAVSMLDDKHHIMMMLRTGVSGYILKNTGYEELKDGLERIQAGEIYVSKQVGEILYGPVKKTDTRKFKQLVNFTERELDVIKLICKGYTSEEIGDELNISRRTVDVHRTNIYRKLNINNIAELMTYAVNNRIITP